MSGTPVICSDRGACRGLVPPEFGFVCSNFDSMPRRSAERRPHFTARLPGVCAWNITITSRMARNYLAEFEQGDRPLAVPGLSRDAWPVLAMVSFELRLALRGRNSR